MTGRTAMPPTRVSIVIPTRNAGSSLEDLLLAVARQEGDFERDLVAVDSGSTDGTIERLHRAGATVLSVASGTFNHGDTRNLALARATGEFAILLVQDALPLSTGWLSALVRPMLADPLIAGTFARQVPSAQASRVTAHYLLQWIAAQSEPRTVGPLTDDQFGRMSPSERHLVCAFDNVCSCVRLSVWRDHPFRSTRIAEDLEWGKEVLLSGCKLAYVPEAVVQHSHERSIGYELQRAYLVHHRLQTLFDLTTIPTLASLLRAITATVPLNARIASCEPHGRTRAVARAAAIAVAQPLGQYLGARAARNGREYLRPRGI
jgi:rhamnosyltransferase